MMYGRFEYPDNIQTWEVLDVLSDATVALLFDEGKCPEMWAVERARIVMLCGQLPPIYRGVGMWRMPLTDEVSLSAHKDDGWDSVRVHVEGVLVCTVREEDLRY